MPERIRDLVETCNLNFLIGSGLSAPYLKTLGQIEALLTRLEETTLAEDPKKIIRCSLYKSYFDGVISKNCRLLEGSAEAEPVLSAYQEFLRVVNSILLRRKSTILGKEANLFTTNVDIFLEKALENVGMECNDGFNGRFKPGFALSNFKKSHFKRSLQYDNISELPTVNLLKLHGSLTWKLDGDEKIAFSIDLGRVKDIQAKAITTAILLEIVDGVDLEALIAGCKGKTVDSTVDAFLKAYDDLLIVNPTKAKFKHTLLNQTHYELLRIYSNELEKENTVLFVMGFSFADEHIREITLRAANSNPTLMIHVIAYDSESAAEIAARFPAAGTRNNNIQIARPTANREGQDAYKYDLPTINKKILGQVLESTSPEAAGASANGGSM